MIVNVTIAIVIIIIVVVVTQRRLRYHAIQTIILPRACSYKVDLIVIALILFIIIISLLLQLPRPRERYCLLFARYVTCCIGNVNLVCANLCGIIFWFMYLLSGTSPYDGLVFNKVFLPLFLSTTSSVLVVPSTNNVS